MASISDFAPLTTFFQGGAPSLSDYIQPRQAAGMPPPATGTSNPIWSGLKSGFYGALQDVGGAGEAVGRAVGASGFADAAAQFAARQQAAERAAANPTYENSPWSPGGIAYQIARAVPSTVGIIGGAALAPEAIGATTAAGALSYPLMVGGNVEAAKEANQGQLTQGNAAKALALGVPEAALGAILPGQLANKLEGGVVSKALGSGLFKSAAIAGAEQAGVSAANTAITQEMGDPNRPIGDRAQEIIDSALSGGLQGGIFGGVVHALSPVREISKTPPNEISNDDLAQVTDKTLAGEQASPQPAPEPAQLPAPPERLALPAPTPAPAEAPAAPTPAPAEAPAAPADVPAPAPMRALPAPAAPEAPAAVEALAPAPAPPAEPTTFTPQEIDAARLEIKKFIAGKKAPDELTPVQQAALHQEIMEREENDRGFKRVETLAKKYGMLNDDNTVVRPEEPTAPQAPTELGADEPGQPVGNAPPRDVIPDAQKADFDRLETLRASLGDNVSDFHSYIDDAQALLQEPTPKNLKIANAIEAKVVDAVRGKQAEAQLRGQETAPAQEQTDAVREPSAAGVDVRQPPSDGQGVGGGNSQGREAAPQDRQGNARARQAAPEASPVAREVAPADLNRIGELVTTARKKLAFLVDKGDVRGDKDTGEYTKLKATFDRDLDLHDDRLSEVQNAIKQARSGDTSALAQIGDDHFANAITTDPTQDSNVLDKYYDKVPAQGPTRKALEAHAAAEQDIVDKIHATMRPETPRISEQSQPQTPQDAALENLINSGATGKDVLEHLKTNGSNGFVKAFATFLSRRGVDPTIRFAERGNLRYDNPRANAAAGDVAASYHGGLDRISLYDRSNLEQSILHEMTHSATSAALDSDKPAAREAQRLFDALKARTPDGDAYGMTNPKEMIAEAFSNQQFRDFLQGQKVETGSTLGNLWQGIKNMVFKALGMPERMRTIFNQVMDVTDRLASQGAGQPGRAGDLETPSVRPGSPQDANSKLKDTFTSLDGLRASTDGVLKAARDYGFNIKPFWRGLLQSWETAHGLAALWKGVVPAMDPFVRIRDARDIRSQNLAQMSRIGQRLAQGLPENVKPILNDVMKYTALNIDPRRTWAEQTWLHGERNAQALQAEAAVANRKWNQLKGLGGDKAYEAMHSSNIAHLMYHTAVAMFDTKNQSFVETPMTGFEKDPFHDYQFRADLHDDPHASAAYWTDAVKGMVAGMQSHFDVLNSTKNTDPKTFKEGAADRTIIKSVLDQAKGAVSSLDNAPNFHLGREGTYFVSAKLLRDEKGNIDPSTLEKIEARMEKAGFGEYALNHNNDNNTVYVRVETPAQMAQLRDLMIDLHKTGMLDQSAPVSGGPISDVNIQGKVSPIWMQRAIESAKAAIPELPEKADQATKDAYKLAVDRLVKQQTAAWLNMLPDNSIKKIYQRRANVQGFNANMVENYTKRAVNSAQALGALSTYRQISNAATAMREQVSDIKHTMGMTADQIIGAHQAASELMLREAQKNWLMPSPGIDAVRALTHTFEVGASPGYFFTLISQIGTLSLPELAKTHGFVASARAIGSATSTAFKVMRATLKGAEGATFGLSRDQLLKEGVPPRTVDFIMHHSNRGDFNLGSYTHAMNEHYDTTTPIGRARSWANALGLYSEMFPRVVTALAARDLYDGTPNKVPARYAQLGKDEGFHQFVSDKIQGSQFNWNAANNPRAVGKGGTFGSASPLINQFMGYKIRMLEKVYNETYNAFSGGVTGTPEERAQIKREARTFLAGHVGAVTLLAGTLGAPFAGAFAGAADKLADLLTGKDNFDLNASYRNWLATTFGKDVGEVIARGLPRAAGIDFSHLGDQNLLPGTQILTEKRKFEDAEKDWLKTMAGSAVGMGANAVLGLRDIANGDYMDGLIKAVPEILKGPLEGARLAQRGYTDKFGTKLPITAGAKDILLQTVGLEPGDEQEYAEARRVEQGGANLREARSQNITRHLVLAQQRGDQNAMQYWAGQSMTFAQDHPGIAPPIANLQQAIGQHMQEGALASSLGLPLGVKPNDLVGRGMTSFGNFPRQ